MKVVANKELWADELKRSYDFYNPEFDFYYDYSYTCRACGESNEWTASEQKRYYEVLKKVRGVSSLCDGCFKEYNKLKSKFRKFHTAWKKETENSKKTALYLKDWLDSIQEYKKYTDKHDSGMEHYLSRLLEENQPNQALKKDADKEGAS